MRNFYRAKASKNFDGWFCSEAFDLVRDAGRHEIACHGFRHVPLGRFGSTTEEAAYELRNATELAKCKGVAPKTFVFPRNDVGNIDLLAQEGFIGFRNSNPMLGRYGRLGNLAREFNIGETAQNREPSIFDSVSIPGGYFLNWRHGFRRAIPTALTRLRWRSILNDAVANDRVAVLWLHPENLSEAPGTLQLLDKIIQSAAELRAAKGLSIVTQAEYCITNAAK
jgi:peptidoglycan/xylan/chitin deacetylase (PgdA/CDA1 family)